MKPIVCLLASCVLCSAAFASDYQVEKGSTLGFSSTFQGEKFSVNCGHQAHADTNAAVNILNRGTAATTNQPTPVGIAAGHVVNGRISPRAHNALGSVNHPVMVA